jgi:hypothetical protein
MVLPCGHYYHQECVATWLTRDCTCPLCKRYVYTQVAPGGTQEAAGGPAQQQQQQQDQSQQVVVVVTGATEDAAAGQQGGGATGGPPNGSTRRQEGPRRGLAATAASFTQQLRATGAGMMGVVVH